MNYLQINQYHKDKNKNNKTIENNNNNPKINKKLVANKSATKLSPKKEENDKKALKQLNANKKIDQINSMPLKSYYRRTLQHIQELAVQIDQVSKQLIEYRQRRRGTKKDITDLLQRKEKMMREFRTLPKIEEDE